ERLNILASTNDGFKIAEYDLECRGPGEFLGARQHGLDEFSAASLAMDVGVLNDAVSAAKEVVENSTKTEYKKLFALAYEKLKNKSDIAMN
ncbi:MAG: DNA helicase RecG, partial [Clostridia bacterium]|nr:DNA helicase RecG [Clostridia bacterium]